MENEFIEWRSAVSSIVDKCTMNVQLFTTILDDPPIALPEPEPEFTSITLDYSP
jgi:hypothetical protein